MERTRVYRRDARHHAICRKKAICLKRSGNDWYDVDGKYDKGKIHCNCGICKVAGDSIRTLKERKISLLKLQEFEDDMVYSA